MIRKAKHFPSIKGEGKESFRSRRGTSFPVLALLCVAGQILSEPSVKMALERTVADLETARIELKKVRETIAEERAQRSKEYQTIQAEVHVLREQWRKSRQAEADRQAEQAAARRRAEAVRSEYRAVLMQLTEFRRSAESIMPIAQRQRYQQLFEEIDARLSADESSGTSLEAVAPTLKLAFALMKHDLPSSSFDGTVLDVDGRVLAGQFTAAGPITFFTNPDTADYVSLDPSGMEPVLSGALPSRAQRTLHEWSVGSTLLVPIDVTNGSLIKLAHATVSFWDRIHQGGVVMIPLLAIGAVCLVIAIRRYIALRRMDIDVDPVLSLVMERLRGGDPLSARGVAEKLMSPWREVLTDAIDHANTNRAYLEEILQERIVMQEPRVSRHLATLAICAAAAPLLGLLGTVTGMIHTFQLITIFGTGDARSLSGGISEALITTQAGLMIAVPALLVHALLARRAGKIMAELELAAGRLIRQIKPESEVS